MHPSYEDRPGAPDRVFAALDDAAYEHQVAAWARVLEGPARRSTTSCTSTTSRRSTPPPSGSRPACR